MPVRRSGSAQAPEAERPNGGIAPRQAAAIVWAIVAMLATPSAQQSNATQRPTFGARVDVVTVDVNVVDNDGRPVQGLAASDFSVTVDGEPRSIQSVSFVNDAPTAPAVTRKTTPVPLFSSNEGSEAGRLIVLFIDQDNIRSGGGRNAIDAAGRFIDTLQPADRVGLIAFPTGPKSELTAEHGKVRAMLAQVVGRESTITTGRNIGLAEALGIEAGDADALARAVARECALEKGPAYEVCATDVETSARTLASQTRQRTRASLEAIRQVLSGLRKIDGPKTMLLVSEALVTGGTTIGEFTDSAPLLQEIQRECAAADVTMFALRLERPLVDVTSRGAPPTAVQDQQLREEGMRSLAAATRGTLFNVIGSPESTFARIARELSGHYLLGFEAQASDRDGRPHRIDVKTTRSGVQVRSRREFIFPAADAAATDEAVLGRVLGAPFLATAVPLHVTTYATRHPDNPKIRLVLSAEIARDVEAPQQVSVAFVLIDGRGKVVASALQKPLLVPRRVPGPVGYVASATVDPGEYTLRLAVRDADGRTGSVEHKARARLNDAAPVQASDLMLADEDPGEPGKWQPSVGAQAAGEISGYLELYSSDKQALENAAVRFEIGETAESPALVVGEARASGPPQNGRRAVTARVALGLLPPGPYVARALVTSSNRTSVRLVRPFVVVPGSGDVAGGPPPVRITPFSDLARAFDVRQVLDPAVLGPFLDRLTAPGSPPVSPSARDAIARAKTGTFDGSFDKLSGASDLASTFLRGLALLSRNDLERAAGEFRASLRESSDFFPAAFYLGACYAAGGRGREAVGAWQTTLAGESDAEIAYLMSFDALARLGDWTQALDVARDAITQWPDDPRLQRRVAAASVMTGAESDALHVLRPYVARHAEDQEALFLAMRLMLNARLHGDGDAGAIDRAEFERYADAYTAAGGPRAALVEVWRRYLARQ